MEFIEKNEVLISLLSGDLTLLSSKLSKINIQYDDEREVLIVELDISLLYTKDNNRIRLVFTDVETFSFFHHKAYYFYYVERYKFFKSKGSFYISLDPADEEGIISSEDQDFILSSRVEGFFI